jgi:hypothetical protein
MHYGLQNVLKLVPGVTPAKYHKNVWDLKINFLIYSKVKIYINYLNAKSLELLSVTTFVLQNDFQVQIEKQHCEDIFDIFLQSKNICSSVYLIATVSGQIVVKMSYGYFSSKQDSFFILYI